jgi:hypothetical protein
MLVGAKWTVWIFEAVVFEFPNSSLGIVGESDLSGFIAVRVIPMNGINSQTQSCGAPAKCYSKSLIGQGRLPGSVFCGIRTARGGYGCVCLEALK